MQMYVDMMIGMDWSKNYIVGLNYVRNVDPTPNRWSLYLETIPYISTFKGL